MAKLEYERNQGFSPVQLFQRIDRASKGHLTRLDFKQFFEENGYKHVSDLAIVIKVKTTF